MKNSRNIITVISLIIILASSIVASVYMYQSGPSYDGSNTDVYDLYQNPEEYDLTNPGGIADVIIKENLAKTEAANAVSAVVFDFRGYDTMGESFILITAVAGSLVILRTVKKKEGEEE